MANIRYSDRSAEDLRREAVKDNILDTKSIVIGLILFFGMILGGTFIVFTGDENDRKNPGVKNGQERHTANRSGSKPYEAPSDLPMHGRLIVVHKVTPAHLSGS